MHPYLLLLAPALLLAVQLLIRLYQIWASPLASVPGPWLARFTDLWYAWRIDRGQFERDNIALHQKHGKPLCWVACFATDAEQQAQSSVMVQRDIAFAIPSLPRSSTDMAALSSSRPGMIPGAIRIRTNGPSSRTAMRNVTAPTGGSTRTCIACLH